MKQTDKYKTLAALVRGFFEGFMSGVLDGQNIEQRDKRNPQIVKKAMLDYYESIAPTFHDLAFYPIAALNFDLDTITSKVKQLYKGSPTPEQLLQEACTDDAMHQAVVAEYRRNFSDLLEGRLATEQEHFDNYTRNSGEPSTVDTATAIRAVVKTAMKAYYKGVMCSVHCGGNQNRASTILLMISATNLVVNDTPIEQFAAQAQSIDEVIFKACGSTKNLNAMKKAVDEAITELAEQ